MLDYDALAKAGFETVVVNYSGSSDEGYINDIEPSPLPEGTELSHELYETIERWAYDVLEEKHGGWEINEGSDGHITINVKARSAFLHHGQHYEQTRWFDSEV